MDRRYLRTERLLTEAILTIIREKPYRDITVADIADRADVAKKTFYAHYENKQQLLWHSLHLVFQQAATETTDLHPDTLLMDGKPLSYPVYKHVQEYALFYRGILSEDGDLSFILQLWDTLAAMSQAKHQPLRDAALFVTVPPELTATLLTGALLGSIRWWLQTDMQNTPEQMAYRFSQILAPGVLQSLGFDA